MKKILLTAMLLLSPSFAFAGILQGVFQTEPGDTGGFLHVQMGACADDASKTCGTIIRAYKKGGAPDPAYANLGKPIVWNMSDNGETKWSGGKIWAPDRDKTYNSKMSMVGANLVVEGCILFICRGQTWVPVP